MTGSSENHLAFLAPATEKAELPHPLEDAAIVCERRDEFGHTHRGTAMELRAWFGAVSAAVERLATIQLDADAPYNAAAHEALAEIRAALAAPTPPAPAPTDTIAVPRRVIGWLRSYYPSICEKSGLTKAIVSEAEAAPPAPAEPVKLLRSIGGQMANILFNWSQEANSVGAKLRPDDRAMLKRLQLEWDAALAASSPSVMPASETSLGDQEERFFTPEFEVWQADAMQASASGPRETALAEAMRYAAQYVQDGPVRVFEVVRLLVSDSARESAGSPGGAS